MNTFLVAQIATYGSKRLAVDLGVSPQAVSKWTKRGEIPPRRVYAAAKLLQVPAERLAPELYGVIGSSEPLTDST